MVALPYRAYPAATIWRPFCKASASVNGGPAFSSGFLKMAKMEPMDTRQSMLEEPSRGSKVTCVNSKLSDLELAGRILEATYNVFATVNRVDLNDSLVLLGDHQAASVGRPKHVDEELVGQDIQLLDRLSLDVDFASSPKEVGDSSSPDGRTDGFDRRLDAGQKLGQVAHGRGEPALLGQDEPSQSHTIGVNGLGRHALQKQLGSLSRHVNAYKDLENLQIRLPSRIII
jgi:hypothetical protein